MYPNELKTASQAELLQMLRLGLDKTFLEWWEASRRSFTREVESLQGQAKYFPGPFHSPN